MSELTLTDFIKQILIFHSESEGSKYQFDQTSIEILAINS